MSQLPTLCTGKIFCEKLVKKFPVLQNPELVISKEFYGFYNAFFSNIMAILTTAGL